MVATYIDHASYVSQIIGLDYANWATDYGSTITGTVTSDGGNAYTGLLTISWAGQYTLSVQVGGVDVPGYPVTIGVAPADLHPASCVPAELIPSTIPAGSKGSFRIQTRDQYHNNIIAGSLSDNTSSTSATLTLGSDVITGTIVDYYSSDTSSFDGTEAYVSSGSQINGVYLVEFTIPAAATTGNYVPQVLLDGVAVPLTQATIEVPAVTTTSPLVAELPALTAGV